MLKNRNWSGLAFTSMFVIVFPALSWYYLQKGASYRINALKELKQNLGKTGDFSCTPINWKPLTKDSFDGRIRIVNFVRKDGQLTDKQSIAAQKLHDQFGERQDIFFLSLVENADSTEAVAYYAKQKIKRANKTYFVVPGNAELKKTWLDNFKYSLKGDFTQTECPYYVYVDIDGTIRNFYDVNDENQIKKMVEHIAMKIFDKKENPRLTREIEK
jgi:hypothetical protein